MKSKINFRVRYQETDRMGVVHHSVYYVWYEMGRTEWMRERGFTYDQCEAEGWLLPLVESGTKYLNTATYDDLIEVETVYCPDDKGISFHFEYTVRNLSRDQTVATGFTHHVCVNREFRIDRRAAKQIKEIFNKAQSRGAGNRDCQKYDITR